MELNDVEGLEAYFAQSKLLNDSWPQKEKDPRSFSIPCFINDICFTNALADLGASVRVMPYATYNKLDFIVLDMPEDIKTPLIHGRPFLSTTHAKIDVYKGTIALRVGEDKIVLTTNKPTSNIIRRVYAISSLDRMEARFNDELASEQILKELDARNDLDDNRNDNVEYDVCEEISNGVDDYNGSNEITIIHDLPIFVGTIHVITNFTIVESLDEYCDAGIGDLIVRRPFCSQDIMERFDETITIYDGFDFVTYQLPRACPKLKNLSNAQCNMITPFLKITDLDKHRGITNQYQKNHSMFKGVLRLGLKYVRDEKVINFITHGHAHVHEMN
ncbi:hypothetical protein Tco_1393645 [Tanacetum coccineum]